MIQLTLINQSSARIPRQFLNDWVRRLDLLLVRRVPPNRFRGKDLVVVFLDEKPARKLNKQFRSKDYATDVLSFSSDDETSLGELVICPQVIVKQAREHGLPVREELGYMVLHGVLHLLGFDHEGSVAEAALMYELQDRLFEKLRAGI